MKYVVMVTHGKMAAGIKDSLEMLAGKREEVLALGLLESQGADEFKANLASMLAGVSKDDELIVLGDIIGGSPLSTTLSYLDEAKLLERAVVIGGMNLPLALSCVLMKDTMPTDQLVSTIIAEATGSIKEFVLETGQEEDI
ncbi:MAG: PTS fructose transporter subunit IIA [Erysipelotrichaceae bacterium]|nr:PTS fructose transporter subunit IIA [Erysipelotrichaceae bacterium]